MKRAIMLDRPLRPIECDSSARAAGWVLFCIFALAWGCAVARLFACPFLVALPLGCFAGYLTLLFWNAWRTRRFQRELRDEVSFAQWMEGVNREAARRGYTLTAQMQTTDSLVWRDRWSRQLSPAQAMTAWEEST